MNLLDPRIHYCIEQYLLDEARIFFQARGTQYYEGTALLIGTADGFDVKLNRFFVPEQKAHRVQYKDGTWGVWVELTEQAHWSLTDHLQPGELIYARIHSHPGEAFHSAIDNANQVITHPGALSIVVPYFARKPIELMGCAIYRLEPASNWVRLSPIQVSTLLEVIS